MIKNAHWTVFEISTWDCGKRMIFQTFDNHAEAPRFSKTVITAQQRLSSDAAPLRFAAPVKLNARQITFKVHFYAIDPSLS